MINGKSVSKYFDLIKSATDGHCIVHSIASCLHHYNPSVDKHDIYAFLLHSLRAECLRNTDLYLPFFENINVFDNERDRYIFKKQYDLSFVDIVPQMFANVLCFGIVIINVESEGICNVYEFIPADTISVSSIHVSKILICPSKILIYRNSHHYDAYVPICLKNHNKYDEIISDVIPDVDVNDLPIAPEDGLGQHCATADSRHLPERASQHASNINSFSLADTLYSNTITDSGDSVADNTASNPL